MQVSSSYELPEIAAVFGDDYAILGDAACQDLMIGFAPTADMERVDGIVSAGLVQAGGDARGQALVDEQSHAAVTQGRPPGRPRSGCVRA